MKSEDVDEVRKAIDELSKESGDVVSKLYQSANPDGAQANAESQSANDDEIIVDEKDYAEKKDDDNK